MTAMPVPLPTSGIPYWERLLGSRFYPIPAPGVETIYAAQVSLDADMAALILEAHNSKNRPCSLAHSYNFAEDMLAGDWFLTGEPIIITAEDTLGNGQHRCRSLAYAARQAEKRGFSAPSIPVLVIYGIHPDAFAYMDRTRSRKLRDVFAIQGEDNPALSGAAIPFVQHFLHDGIIINTNMSRAERRMTIQRQFLESSPQLRDSVAAIAGFGGNVRIHKSKGLAAALHYVFSHVSSEHADVFFRTLYSFQIPPGAEFEPVQTLFEKLTKLTVSNKRQIFSLLKVSAYSVQAWNAFLAGEPARLAWNDEKSYFPHVRGVTYGVDNKPNFPPEVEV